jgi:hypothetical protein
VCHLEHAAVAVEKYGVDRESHEGHMDRGGRTKKQSFTAREIATPEQSSHARERRVREDTALAHRSSVLQSERDLQRFP